MPKRTQEQKKQSFRPEKKRKIDHSDEIEALYDFFEGSLDYFDVHGEFKLSFVSNLADKVSKFTFAEKLMAFCQYEKEGCGQGLFLAALLASRSKPILLNKILELLSDEQLAVILDSNKPLASDKPFCKGINVLWLAAYLAAELGELALLTRMLSLRNFIHLDFASLPTSDSHPWNTAIDLSAKFEKCG